MKSIRYRFMVLMLCVTTLFGCGSMRSDYQSPELNLPENWPQKLEQEVAVEPQEQTPPLVIQMDEWWRLFDDPQLNSVIDKVLASNSDLAKATLTLRKARLVAGVSENDKVPKLSFSQDLSSEYDIDNDSSDNSVSTSFSLSYELDLWGRVDAVADADEWTARASFEDRESTAQSLVVTTATLYWKVAYLNQMIVLTEQNITGTKRVASLTKNKYDSGSATYLEVLESTQTLFTQQVQLSQLQQELSETQNAVSILLNQPIQDTGVTIEKLSSSPVPDIEPGIPSDLLLRRPDVRASLYALKSSLASKDAIAASYMPTLTLTGSLSTSSTNLVELLQNPVAKLGSGIVLPFLEWEQMSLNKSISQVDYELAVIDYRDTIYQALEEVANLLTTKERIRYQGNVIKEQYINAKEIERIYGSRYQNGASDMIDWINAMESRRSIESSVLVNRYNQFLTQIKLYQALGGGDIAPMI